MKRTKIAISLDSALLKNVDGFVDGQVIRSRSQAIEYFLSKGIASESIRNGVIMLSAKHQKSSLSNYKGRSLLMNQIEFFRKSGISSVYILTQSTDMINDLLNEASKSDINVQIIQTSAKGNAGALRDLKSYLQRNNFIVMSGDIFIDINLRNMIKKHIDSKECATIGLMSRQETSKFGNVILDGDIIIDFIEKPQKIRSNIVNGGIYIFRPELFEFFDPMTDSLELDLFPKLAKLRQARGYFLHGEYKHMEEP